MAARMLLLLVLLIAAWLLWSGLFKPLLLGLGAFSCLLTVYLARRMGYFDNEVFALRFGPRLIGYWAWLAKEIARSSFEVARIVLNPRLPISPQVFEIKATATHPVDQTLLANSITLTPGTLALDVHNGVILVHSLTKSGADELITGEMDRRVAALRED
jgi:multicomponent Na+:H+ antiporter subunit E